MERQLFSEMKITYMTGKGNNHLVPVLIPSDTLGGLEALSDPEIRKMSNVNLGNRYMFPSTQLSLDHVSGWHAIHRVCLDANVLHPERLTATKMRHRVSTIYAAMDVPASQRAHFYNHMGHSSNINASIYQTPPAEAEVLMVGTHLMAMDGRHSVERTTHTPDNRSSSSLSQPCRPIQEPIAISVIESTQSIQCPETTVNCHESAVKNRTTSAKGKKIITSYVMIVYLIL